MRKIQLVGIALALLLTAGCFNGNGQSNEVSNVSVGQQMIDLKTALEQDAITQQEYDRLKRALLAANGADDESEE